MMKLTMVWKMDKTGKRIWVKDLGWNLSEKLGGPDPKKVMAVGQKVQRKRDRLRD